MAKKPRPEGKKYNFMDTYGDLVTLLMCFFVLLFAMSTIEEEKYDAFAQALQGAFGTATAQPSPAPVASQVTAGQQDPTGDMTTPDETLPSDFSSLSQQIQEYVEQNNMQGDVSVVVGESGAIFIRVSEGLLFGGNSSALREESTGLLHFLGVAFLEVDDEIYQVKFLGHTASEAGSGVDDRMLSAERAGRVASYFERTVGYSPYKMLATGYGRHYPVGDNNTPEGKAMNRRVDIIVVSNDPTTLAVSLLESSQVYFPGDDTTFFEGPPAELPGNMMEDVLPDALDYTALSPEERETLQNTLEDYIAQSGSTA